MREEEEGNQPTSVKTDNFTCKKLLLKGCSDCKDRSNYGEEMRISLKK